MEQPMNKLKLKRVLALGLFALGGGLIVYASNMLVLIAVLALICGNTLLRDRG